MATRDELYKQFGAKLVEAITLVILDEVNTLRTNAGLSERNASQIVNAISAKLPTIADYDVIIDV